MIVLLQRVVTAVTQNVLGAAATVIRNLTLLVVHAMLTARLHVEQVVPVDVGLGALDAQAVVLRAQTTVPAVQANVLMPAPDVELPVQIIVLGVQAVALLVQKAVPAVPAAELPVQIIVLGVRVVAAAVLRVLGAALDVQAVALHAQTTVPAVVLEAVIADAPANVRAVRATAQALVPQSV